MFKTLKRQMPLLLSHIYDMFSARDVTSFYNICHSENIFRVSKPRSNFLKLSCLYEGAALWNGLPSVRTTKPLNLTRFKDGIND